MRLRPLAAIGMSAALLPAAAPAGAFVVQSRPGLQSPANGIALGPDGNFWIAEESTGSVVRMTPLGTVLNRYQVGIQPTTVATGPGGRVWVAVTGADKLVWFDATAPAPSPHDVPTGPPTGTTCGPVALVSGGDGRMYFSLPAMGGCGGGNVLGSVPADTVNGPTTEIAVLGAQVFDLAVSGGRLFAPDFAADRVVPVALGATPLPTAPITVPTAGGAPDGVAADGAGNIWFTEFSSGKIGRFPATQIGGAATELTPAGGTLTNPFGIVAGAGGNMYVVGSASQNIARVSPAGAFAFFAVPNSQPWRIVNGADGDLWFTDRLNTRVLRFINSAPRASLTTAAGRSPTTAAVLASVEPRGNDTQVVFDYGPTADYGSTTAPAAVPSGGDPVPVLGDVTGLSPSMIYHVRVRATNAEGTTASPDLTFSTLATALPGAVPGPGSGTRPPAVVPKLAVTTSFAFTRFATSTIVRRISLAKLAGGETATIRCTGKRCPFKLRTYKTLKKGARTFGKALLKSRKLPVGTTISVRVTAPDTIGTSTLLKVRRRRTPQITRRCLPPGTTAPTACA